MKKKVNFKNVKNNIGSKFPELASVIVNLSFETGIPTLTEKTIDEFYKRCCELAIVKGEGPLPNDKKRVEGSWMKLRHIRLFLGLVTNAVGLKRNQFEKRLVGILQSRSTLALQTSKESNKFLVRLNVRRLIEVKEFTPEEKKFWGNFAIKNRTTWVTFISETYEESSALMAEAIEAFYEQHPYLRQKKFHLTVVKLKRENELFY